MTSRTPAHTRLQWNDNRSHTTLVQSATAALSDGCIVRRGDLAHYKRDITSLALTARTTTVPGSRISNKFVV